MSSGTIQISENAARRRGVGKRGRLVALTLAAFALCSPFVSPFYFLITSARKTSQNSASNRLGLPHPATVTQFSAAWHSASLGQSLLNSTIAAGIGAVVTILLSAPAADWGARTKSRAKTNVLGTLARMWVIPTIIWVIPMFVEISREPMTGNPLLLAGNL